MKSAMHLYLVTILFAAASLSNAMDIMEDPRARAMLDDALANRYADFSRKCNALHRLFDCESLLRTSEEVYTFIANKKSKNDQQLKEKIENSVTQMENGSVVKSRNNIAFLFQYADNLIHNSHPKKQLVLDLFEDEEEEEEEEEDE